jgi:hypothetical protein
MRLFTYQGLQLLPVAALCSLIGGCSTVTQVDQLGSQRPPRTVDCQVEIFDKSTVPTRYETLGAIETHIAGNFFFGGVVRADNEGAKELRKKACALGGNAVVIDDSMESASAEMHHVHIWARVINKLD